MGIALIMLTVFGLLILGAPIAVALGMASLLFLVSMDGASLAQVAQGLFQAIAGNYTLLSVPFFIIAASFVATGGVARRVIRLTLALFGSMPGGLILSGVFACLIFAGLAGSSPITVVAVGSVVIAAMQREAFSKHFTAGAISGAGTLGMLVPPSIPMVMYAVVTDTSVAQLFMGGVVPGIVAAVMMMVVVYFLARRLGLSRGAWAGWGEVARSTRDTAPALVLVGIVLGGIGSGYFTPTDAAVVAAVYAFVLANFIYRDVGPLAGTAGQGPLPLWRKPKALVAAFWHEDTRNTVFESGKLTVTLMFIIANALLLKQVLENQDVPQQTAQLLADLGVGPIFFLILLNIALLFLGQFLEPSGLVVIVAPLVLPVAIALDIDPVHLGVMMMVNLQIGLLTPPVGLNLFVTSGVTGMTMLEVAQAVVPFLLVLLVFLGLVAFVPEIVTWLPDALLDRSFGSDLGLEVVQ